MKRVFSLILALVMVIGLLPQIPLSVRGEDPSTGFDLTNLRYDDHVDMTGKTVEIVDAGTPAVVTIDNNYMVASGIGTAQVRIDGMLYEVTVEKAKINLIMIMGQSNAGNHFPNATSDVTCPVGTAYWWGNGEGTAAAEPVLYTQPSMGFHTPLLAELYAQSVAAGDPVKNVLIWEEGITSKNGQSIVKWAKSAADTSGTDDAVTMVTKCRAYYEANSDKYEIVGSGVYWLQGESDSTMDPTLYTQRFMAMWQRLKNAGMEYVAFLRVRRATSVNPETRDDLYHSASLSAQIQMINSNPEFYMATTVTENWVGTPSALHTVDISNYITMMHTYGQNASYTDQYGNSASYSDGKLTTTMKSLYGSNNTCHYGKFGYGVIGADAAYNMYHALHTKNAAIVVTDTSGHANRAQRLTDGQSVAINIEEMTDNLSFRPGCGSTKGTLRFSVYSGQADITNQEGVIVGSGERYGSVDTAVLRSYEDVSIAMTYTAADGTVHTARCNIQSKPAEPKENYIWDFNQDLNARDRNGEVLNAFLNQPLAGSYTLEDGYLTAKGLQLELENIIKLQYDRNWSVEWKYGALNGGTAGFLLCEDKGNTVGNKALWHTNRGNFTVADYADSVGYRNYTNDDIVIHDNDCLKLTNAYDPATGNSTLSLWINGELVIADFQLKGSINNYHDNQDMTGYPLVADFEFRYLGNTGMRDWYANCQLDYLRISFGETQPDSIYLQPLPADLHGCENLYTKLTPVKGYYTATKYDTSNGQVLSVVIPVEPGDRIAASSFGSKAENMGSVDGIRVTYLLGDKIVSSLSAGTVYNAYTTTGYITVPEGVDAVCIPWWVPSDRNWLTLSQVSKDFATHSPKSVPAQAPTCTESGYTAGEVCEYCGDPLGTREEIPATGHSYNGDTCTVCGNVNILANLDGKYVSILGDSISTFRGYSNDATVNSTIGGNGPRYDAGAADTKPGSYCLLESVEDTWWMDFANRSGMKLLVNNSWAGSQVFGGQTSDGRVIPAAYLERCVNLHDDTLDNNPGNTPIHPDVIFVYLGINDYNFNRSQVGTGTVDYAKLISADGTYVTPTTFGEAYGILLHKMKNAYPNAQIFAMSLLPENLYSVDMAAWEQHNAYIRAAAQYYGIPLVDLAKKCAITWDNYSGYMIDKIHPTTAGMKLISDCIEAELVSYYSRPMGDVNGDGAVTYSDAVYLLLHTLFGAESYPLSGAAADFDGSGDTGQDDAVYLLLHTLFGESFYPLAIS